MKGARADEMVSDAVEANQSAPDPSGLFFGS